MFEYIANYYQCVGFVQPKISNNIEFSCFAKIFLNRTHLYNQVKNRKKILLTFFSCYHFLVVVPFPLVLFQEKVLNHDHCPPVNVNISVISGRGHCLDDYLFERKINRKHDY